MALLSFNNPGAAPEPLGPLAPGHRRAVFTRDTNLLGLVATKGSIRDFPIAEIPNLVALGLVVLFDDLPEEDKTEPEPEPIERPAVNAPKADWIQWAVSQGCNHLEAMQMTKAQLQNEYGERL